MDRLTSLTVFGRVVETGGFSAAARKLNMSVTMVSNHVQALEDRLGARLLNRTTRKLSLTEIGTSYYERTTQILAELDDADRIAGALQATPRGVLRIHTSMNVVRFLSPIITEYLTANPAVSVDLAVGEKAVDMIEDGYDLAIRTIPPPESGLIVRRLTPWRHILCCAPAYLDAHPIPQSLTDLAHHNCLRFTYYPFGDDWRFDGADGKPVSAARNCCASQRSADLGFSSRPASLLLTTSPPARCGMCCRHIARWNLPSMRFTLAGSIFPPKCGISSTCWQTGLPRTVVGWTPAILRPERKVFSANTF
jgi:DNA-binding transcriptional LysR family regulator